LKILVTGADGFVGRNLVENLKNIRDGKEHSNLLLRDKEQLSIIEYDRNNTIDELEDACCDCDFVFNFAGVNRPRDDSEFMEENYGFASILIDTLKKFNNTCQVMLSSSIQATLLGRYANSTYGKSKLYGEELFFNYALETGSKVLVYRFPNLFGKWCKPNYNSVVATFCNAIANDLEYHVDDTNIELNLLYIDDLIEEMIGALNGKEHHCEYNGLIPVPKDDGKFCFVPLQYKVTLGEILDLLDTFKSHPNSLMIPNITKDSFAKKLYSTYLSYLPKEKMSFPLQMKKDERGSFTEFLKSNNAGQVSINVTKPGITKGEHWHNSKWEIFVVVRGHALIQERKVDSDEVREFEVSDDNFRAVYMLPGYTHSIKNLSDSEDLITIMWANEIFNSNAPDTFSEKIKRT